MAQHRRSMSGLKVEESMKWGNDTAYRRYGSPQHFHGAPQPRDQSQPQFREDKPSGNLGDHRNDWVRGAGQDATGKPGFDHRRK